MLWKINRKDYNTIDQLGCKVAHIVKQSVNISTVLKPWLHTILLILLKLAQIYAAAEIRRWKYLSFWKRMILTSLLSVKPGLKVDLSLISRIIPLRAMIDQKRQEGSVAILVRNDIKFDIIDTCSTLNTDNEAITVLKNSQDLTSISTIYVPPASTINTTLLNNIKNG